MPAREYVSAEILGIEEIQRIAAAKRYSCLSQEIKDKDLEELIVFFKNKTTANNAFALYESGRATSPKEAQKILQEEEFADRLDQYS